MASSTLIRWGGAACILAGLTISAFVLIHPWDQLVGADIARTVRWRLAHTLHFAGAIFMLLGLPGIYGAARHRMGGLGRIGFVVACLGNAMFLGTGMITAFIWPMLAMHAPATVEIGGPMIIAPMSATAFLLTAVAIVVGYVMFGAALLRTMIFPRWAVIMLIVGAVMGMLPPNPASIYPWAALVFGGVLYGAAMIWLGALLWRMAPGGFARPA